MSHPVKTGGLIVRKSLPSNALPLLVVPEARENLLDKWGIDSGTNVGTFDRDQQAFLDYHRANVFRGS